MKLEGTYEFKQSREELWSAVIEPATLSRILPGIQEFEQIGENEYRAKMNLRIGPVQGLFSGTVTLSEIREMVGYHLAIDAKGSPGFVRGEGDLSLEQKDSGTSLNYSGDAQIGGRLASVGQRLMETSAQALIRQSLEALEAQLAARTPGADGEEADFVPPQPPSQLEFAAGVTRKMLEDLVPPEQREDLLRGGAALAGLLVVLWVVVSWWTNLLAKRIAANMREIEDSR